MKHMEALEITQPFLRILFLTGDYFKIFKRTMKSTKVLVAYLPYFISATKFGHLLMF